MKIQTFEETLQQLDQVFTDSAVPESSRNIDIAAEIRKIQQGQLKEMF